MMNEKIGTIKSIDGNDLYRASIFVLSKFHNSKKYFKINKEEGQSELQIINPALLLLTRCMCFFDPQDDLLVQQAAGEFHYFLDSNKLANRITNNHALFTIDEAKFYLRNLISDLIFRISFYQPYIVINYFAYDMIQLICLIPSLFEVEETYLIESNDFESNDISEDDKAKEKFIIKERAKSRKKMRAQFIETIFGTLNNMVYKSDEFAVFLPACSSLFEIQGTEDWNENGFLNFYRLQDNIFLRLIKCDSKEEDWQKSINNIEEHVESIFSNGISFYESYSFKVKKQFILMVCHLLDLDDPLIISGFCSFQEDLILIFIENLNNNDLELTENIAHTLIFLCKKASIDENINVLDILMQNDIDEIIESLMHEAEVDHNIQILYNQIQKMSQELLES